MFGYHCWLSSQQPNISLLSLRLFKMRETERHKQTVLKRRFNVPIIRTCACISRWWADVFTFVLDFLIFFSFSASYVRAFAFLLGFLLFFSRCEETANTFYTWDGSFIVKISIWMTFSFVCLFWLLFYALFCLVIFWSMEANFQYDFLWVYFWPPENNSFKLKLYSSFKMRNFCFKNLKIKNEFVSKEKGREKTYK